MPASETFIFLPGNLARPKAMVGSSCAGLESSHLHSSIWNQSAARVSSAMVAAGGYPDGERVSVWYGSLCLQEYNNHINTPGTHPAGGTVAVSCNYT